MLTFKKSHLLCAGFTASLLTGCGGSSGSSTPPVAVPPPPVNAAPVVNIEANKTNPDEGQPFTIDARPSTDAEGDTLTFAIRQTSGPTAIEDMGDGTAGIWNFKVPELSASENLIFKVDVSDGTNTSSETLTISAANITLSPAFNDPTGNPFTLGSEREEPLNAKLQFKSQYWYRDGSIPEIDTYIGPYPTNDDNITIKNNDDINQTDIPSDGNFEAAFINLDGDHTNEHESVGIVLADLDKQEIGIWRSEAAPVFFKTQSIDTQNMCDIGFFKADFVDPDSYLASWSKHTSSADQHLDMLVGLDGGGIEVYRRRLKNPGSTLDDYFRHDETPSFKLADTGHYCDLFGPFGTRVLFEGGFYTVSTEFMGFDRVAKTFSVWESSDSPNRLEPVVDETAEDRAKLMLGPIDVNIPDGLEIISVKMGSIRGQPIIDFKEYYPTQFYTIVLVSDGKHDGDHRVISYFWERGTTPTEADRQEIKWNKGVPSDMSLVTSRVRPDYEVGDTIPPGDDPTPDIVITAPELPYLIVLENTKIIEDGTPFKFAEPAYIEGELGIERRVSGRYMLPSKKKSFRISRP